MRRKKKTVKWVWRKKDPSAPSPPPPWVDLPRDIMANILQRLGAVEILESAQKVCKTWEGVCRDPAMWRKISFCLDTCFPPKSDLEIMCWHAIDRSQGELLDISIYGFGSDLLLEHIVNSSSQLRSLTLGYCHGMTCKGVIEAVRALSLLEKIQLAFIAPGPEFIEEIGFSCPNLKTFAMNQARSVFQQSDSEALAIAKSMPELLHLSLIGNQMSDQDLEAILDGCTHLESLDLRQCFAVELRGDLGKRCSQQLKSLKTPNELAGEYDYDELEADDESDGFTDWLDCDIEFAVEYDPDEVEKERDHLNYDRQVYGFTDWHDSTSEVAREYDSDEPDEETDGLSYDSQVSDNDEFSSDDAVRDTLVSLLDEVVDIVGITDSMSERRRKLDILEMPDLLIVEEEGSKEEEQAKASNFASQKDCTMHDFTKGTARKAQAAAQQKADKGDQLYESSHTLAVLASASSVSKELENKLGYNYAVRDTLVSFPGEVVDISSITTLPSEDCI